MGSYPDQPSPPARLGYYRRPASPFQSQHRHAYRYWTRQFILFHGKGHPHGMGPAEVEAFLNDLAVNRRVAASTQSQALNAIVFRYDSVLSRP
jgi:hypothetical protein